MNDLKRILFLDIETVSSAPDYQKLPEAMKHHWTKKSRFMRTQYAADLPDEDFYAVSFADKAGIFAEFGKIVCISVGILTEKEGKFGMRLKSFYGDDEKELLTSFSGMLDSKFPDPNRSFICGHNVREFDVPYLGRRMLINGLKLPELLNLSGKKPWETKHLIDTLELWKFGDIKHYVSLDLLSSILNVPSPKDDIDGSMVSRVYWQDKDVQRIATYCEKDVVTVANVLLRMQQKDLIHAELIENV